MLSSMAAGWIEVRGGVKSATGKATRANMEKFFVLNMDES